MQEKVRTGVIELRKVRGDVNPAYLFTKYIPSGDKIKNLIELFSCQFREGRAASAPQLRRDIDGVGFMGEFEDAVYAQGESNAQGEFEYPAHDPAVLPHHYREDELDEFFPKAKVEDFDDDLFPDVDVPAGGRYAGWV